MSAACVLEGLSPDTLEPLVGASEWNRFLRLAHDLPSDTSAVCFECRLQRGAARADFAFSLFPFHANSLVEASERRLSPDGAREWQGSRASASNGDWIRFHTFLREWGSPGALLHTQVPFVCVAFDTSAIPAASDAPAVPATPPCVSLCVDPDFFAKRMGFRSTDAAGERDAQELVAVECYSRLAGASASEPTRRHLRRAMTFAGAELKHISCMLPRPERPFKANLRLHVEELARFLHHIGWRTDALALAREVRRFVTWPAYVQVNLVLHPEGDGPLEVEIFPGAAESTDEARSPLLDRLIGDGLVDPDKADVLRQLERDPRRESRHGRPLGLGSYLKLKFDGTRAFEAKAYVGVMPRLARSQSGGARP